MAFVDNLYPRIYISMNLYTIKIYLNYPDYTTNELKSHETGKGWLHTNIGPNEYK